jgi:hypothetical protein
MEAEAALAALRKRGGDVVPPPVAVAAASAGAAATTAALLAWRPDTPLIPVVAAPPPPASGGRGDAAMSQFPQPAELPPLRQPPSTAEQLQRLAIQVCGSDHFSRGSPFPP